MRNAEVKSMMTEEDASTLTEFADALGFKSRSEFITAIMERLLLGGFAPVAWLKLGWQIRNRAEKVGIAKGAGFYNPFESWPPLPVEDRPPRPNPALPDEQLSAQQTKQLLAEVKKELKHA